MIPSIKSRNDYFNAAPLSTTPTDCAVQKNNIISPTYMCDIQSIGTDGIDVRSISKYDKAAINSIEKEIGAQFAFTGYKAEDQQFGGQLIHEYNIGGLAKEMGIPLATNKILGYTNPSGAYVLECYLEGGRKCQIGIHGQPTDQPIDATTFKNVALKAIKITFESMEQCEAIAGQKYSFFDGNINYDPTTKKADFEKLKADQTGRITCKYETTQITDPECEMESIEKYLAEFYDEFYKTLDRIA